MVALCLAPSWAAAADVICHHCVSQAAQWAPLIDAIKRDLRLDVSPDRGESTDEFPNMVENGKPGVDIAYLDAISAVEAKELGLLQPYKPRGSEHLHPGLKDSAGYWHAVHSGTLGFFVNKDALRGKPLPACWLDLLKPEYRGLVAYIDPSVATVGYVAAVAINLAFGGPKNDFGAAIGFLRELGKNGAVIADAASDARLLAGEVAVLLDYDFNAYRAKYAQKEKFEFVLPCEGSVVFPYAMCLVNGAPHRQSAERVLDYLLSEKGQAAWTSAFVRPARSLSLPPAINARFLPEREYARAKIVDWGEMESYQKAFIDRYLAEAR